MFNRPLSLLAVALVLVLAPPLFAEDLWLAVGYGGRRMISTDGKTWTITAEWAQPGGDDKNNLMSAVYGQGKFVVVGGGGGGKTGGGHILVSTDGKEWKSTFSDASRINPVVFGNDRFIVGRSSYPSGKLMVSQDAEQWNEGAAIAAKGLTHFRHGAFGNGIFILVGNGQKKDAEGKNQPMHWAIVTADGAKITQEKTDLPAHGQIHFGAGRFVMLSHEGVMLSTKDGIEWKEQPFTKEEKPGWLVWDGSRFLAGSYKTGWQSKDGLTWEKSEIKGGAHIVWSDGQRFIATGWPGKMSYSSDGRTWEKSPPMTDNGINIVVKASQAK